MKKAKYDWEMTRFPFDFMIKETCKGILKEGGLIGQESTAIALCKQIEKLEFDDWNGLCK